MVGVTERGEEGGNGFQSQPDAELFKPIKVLDCLRVIHNPVEEKRA